MKLLFTLVLFTNIVYSGIAQKKSISHIVFFNTNSFTVDETANKQLLSLKQKINGRKLTSVHISGYTDAIGSNQQNNTLSLQRANTIQQWLIQNINNWNTAIPITQDYFGENNPIADNSTEDGKAKNRRVLVHIEMDLTPAYSINNLHKKTTTAYQEYCIDNTKDTLLIGKQGSMVYIRANSIQKPSTANTCITIRIKEALKINDIIKDHLTTTTNGQLLYSQSMVYVDALHNGISLALQPNSSYVVFSPTDTNLDDIGLYNGIEDSVGNINWQLISNGKIPSIKAKSLKNCMGRAMPNCIVPDIPCDNTPLIFGGLFKLIKYSFQPLGKIKKREYKNCWRRRVNNRHLTKEQLKSKQDLSKLYAVIPTTNQTCYPVQVGPCGILVSLLDMNCAINYEKEVTKSMDSMLKNGTAITEQEINNLQYAVFTRSGLGWSNLDWMYRVPESDRETITFDLDATPNTNVKIIFQNRKTILQATGDSNGNLAFVNIPKNEPATLLITDTRSGTDKILAQKLTITTGESTIQPDFEAMTLKQYLELINSFGK